MKVLIVDDNPSLCEMYTILLKSNGYEAMSCHDGLEAITTIVDFQPDVVLLDIMMPEMNGHEFLEALTHNTSLDPVIIVFSNIGEQVEIDRALEYGADAFLQKSDYTGKDLVDAIGKIYNDTVAKRYHKP